MHLTITGTAIAARLVAAALRAAERRRGATIAGMSRLLRRGGAVVAVIAVAAASRSPATRPARNRLPGAAGRGPLLRRRRDPDRRHQPALLRRGGHPVTFYERVGDETRQARRADRCGRRDDHARRGHVALRPARAALRGGGAAPRRPARVGEYSVRTSSCTTRLELASRGAWRRGAGAHQRHRPLGQRQRHAAAVHHAAARRAHVRQGAPASRRLRRDAPLPRARDRALAGRAALPRPPHAPLVAVGRASARRRRRRSCSRPATRRCRASTVPRRRARRRGEGRQRRAPQHGHQQAVRPVGHAARARRPGGWVRPRRSCRSGSSTASSWRYPAGVI